jgi:aldose 1-epimerase
MGWHPYFPRGDAVLEAPVTAVWAADAGGISTGTAALGPDNDLRLARALSDITLDHAFECGTEAAGASARIVWPERDVCLLMTASPGLGRLVVYAPPGGDFFCVEPLSHAPDAINRPPPHADTGLKVLAPGEIWEETIRLELG